MLIVRFPNGQAVTYNKAHHLKYGNALWELYTKEPEKGGIWIASIQASAGATVESIPACRVENPIQQLDAENAFGYVLEHICEYDDSELLRKLKAELKNYNTRTGEWK